VHPGPDSELRPPDTGVMFIWLLFHSLNPKIAITLRFIAVLPLAGQPLSTFVSGENFSTGLLPLLPDLYTFSTFSKPYAFDLSDVPV
jgi:hypothetical protein